MKAIILAAGRGSRMQEGTKDIPKCMMTLAGVPLLERCVSSLHEAGFESSEIGIVTGYCREKIQIPGVNYFHNADWESTNMFISLTMASEWLVSEPCLVCYSDIVFSPKAVQMLVECSASIAITYYTGFWELWNKRMQDPLTDLETFKVRGTTLIEIGNKPSSKEEIQGQYMGFLRFTPSGWHNVMEAIEQPLPKQVEKLDMTTLLQHMLSLGHDIVALPSDDLWLECDSLEDIRVYEREFAFYKSSSMERSNSY